MTEYNMESDDGNENRYRYLNPPRTRRNEIHYGNLRHQQQNQRTCTDGIRHAFSFYLLIGKESMLLSF